MKISRPHFELTKVYDDGSKVEPQVVPIKDLPLDSKSDRRGFLGVSQYLLIPLPSTQLHSALIAIYWLQEQGIMM